MNSSEQTNSALMPTDRKKHFSFQRIIVSVESSKYSIKAFDVAVDLAQRYASVLTVIHILTYPIHMSAVEDGDELVNRFVARAKKMGLDASGRIVRCKSSVLHGILKEAENENADLIVVGTRGLEGLRKFFGGSVSSGVAAHSAQSVLIVK